MVVFPAPGGPWMSVSRLLGTLNTKEQPTQRAESPSREVSLNRGVSLTSIFRLQPAASKASL